MSDIQDALRDAWLGGPEDRLCGREQAKAWALRETWFEEDKGTYGMYEFIRTRVRKTKNGKATGDHPTVNSLKSFFEKVDSDPDWFPGKHSDAKRGPKRILTGPKKNAVIQAAKRIKRDGGEVTYSAVVAACPTAVINPDTGEAVGKKLVYTVFREDCYTDDPDDRWEHRARPALGEKQIAKRYDWALYMRGLTHTAGWYYKNLVWCDLCNSILPRTERVSGEQARARKGRKGWGSKSEQEFSLNLRGNQKVLKMKSTDTIRIWWVPVLSRGKLHIEPLPEDFPGETEEGAAIMVARVRAALNIRFPSGPPKILFTDRGNGFYESFSGKIMDGYRDALREHGLKAFMGADASIQPGSLQELMLHETTVSWLRNLLSKSVPRKAWEESRDEYFSRLKAQCAHINANYNVENLCHALPKRVQLLYEKKGDRLKF